LAPHAEALLRLLTGSPIPPGYVPEKRSSRCGCGAGG
jgi:hypothetical protein